MAQRAETQTYYVSKLSGPRIAGKRVTKGDEVALTEPQARAELLAGALVRENARVDDPWGEEAARAAAAAEAEAKLEAAEQAKAAADAKVTEAQHDVPHDPAVETH